MAFVEANLARERNIADLVSAKRSQDQNKRKMQDDRLWNIIGLLDKQGTDKEDKRRWESEFGFNLDQFGREGEQWGEEQETSQNRWLDQLGEGQKERDLRWRIANLDKGAGGGADRNEKKEYAMYQAFDDALRMARAGSYFNDTMNYEVMDANKDAILDDWAAAYKNDLVKNLGYSPQEADAVVRMDRDVIERYFKDIMSAEEPDVTRNRWKLPEGHGGAGGGEWGTPAWRAMNEDTSQAIQGMLGSPLFSEEPAYEGVPGEPFSQGQVEPAEQEMFDTLNRLLSSLPDVEQEKAATYINELKKPGEASPLNIIRIQEFIQQVLSRME